MTVSLLKHTSPLHVTGIPQTEPQEGLVQNAAGGYVHQVDIWTRLMRFLILGTEGGTYYVKERNHTLDNVKAVDEALAQDFQRAIDMAVEVSVEGRAPKNDYALFVLAKGASFQTQAPFAGPAFARNYALSKLPQVARTGTHLFQFVAMVDTMRGWGGSLRDAVANWYLEKDNQKLAYQITKYQQRNGWSHRDVLRKAHPVTDDYVKNAIFRYITQGEFLGEGTPNLTFMERDMAAITHIAAVEAAKTADKQKTLNLITEYGLTREMVQTQYLNDVDVWRALMQKMPYTALIRNLGNMSKAGLLAPLSDDATTVVAKVRDEQAIRRSRVHPMQVLYALATYGKGRGHRGRGEWDVNQDVVRALNDAFYLAFQNVEPTGKRFLLGLDVSGSMSFNWDNGPLTAAEISAAMLMTTLRTEANVHPMAFAGDFQRLPVHAGMSLEEVLRRTSDINFGATDCSLPMRYALENRIPVDVFVVYTDNETWAGRGAPSDWLKRYRQEMGIDAKLIVVGITATDVSIADANDAGMLDIAGFDAATPAIISEFAKGAV